jgi:hypothetical protein
LHSKNSEGIKESIKNRLRNGPKRPFLNSLSMLAPPHQE